MFAGCVSVIERLILVMMMMMMMVTMMKMMMTLKMMMVMMMMQVLSSPWRVMSYLGGQYGYELLHMPIGGQYFVFLFLLVSYLHCCFG